MFACEARLQNNLDTIGCEMSCFVVLLVLWKKLVTLNAFLLTIVSYRSYRFFKERKEGH